MCFGESGAWLAVAAVDMCGGVCVCVLYRELSCTCVLCVVRRAVCVCVYSARDECRKENAGVLRVVCYWMRPYVECVVSTDWVPFCV